RRRHTRFSRDWSSDVCSSDLEKFALNVSRATYVTPTQLSQKKAPPANRRGSRGRTCSSRDMRLPARTSELVVHAQQVRAAELEKIGRASCRERAHLCEVDHAW